MDAVASPRQKAKEQLRNDPVIAPLIALFNNLNLDEISVDHMDIDSFVNHPTPALLLNFLNKQGFAFNAALFHSVPADSLQCILEGTKLWIYLRRKLEKPAHHYSLTYYVHENYYDSDDEQKQQSDSDSEIEPSLNIPNGNDDDEKKPKTTFTAVSPSTMMKRNPKKTKNHSFATPFSDHDTNAVFSKSSSSLKSQSHASSADSPSPSPFVSTPLGPSPLIISASLTSNPHSAEDSILLRNILKGIQAVLIYYNQSKNPYMDAKTGNASIITDAQLKRECVQSTKLKDTNGEFEFEEYAHRMMQILRAQFDLRSFKYLYKLFGIELKNGRRKSHAASHTQQAADLNYAVKYFWKSLITNSKSGQVFYRSTDNLFIIKGLKYEEWHLLTKERFLSHYFRHMQANTDSLLVNFLGIYRINELYFCVMKNINYSCASPASDPLLMHKLYDLKGATHNRRATRHKLLLDRQDFSAMNALDITASIASVAQPQKIPTFASPMEMDPFNELQELQQENIDNIRHKYSQSWYQPVSREDLNKFVITKSDTLKTPKHTNFIFDALGTVQEDHHQSDENEFDEDDGDDEKEKHSSVEVWKRSKILKDLDWVQDSQKIKIGKIRSSFFLNQLDKDLQFLVKMNVMDYSLLVGIHFRTEPRTQSSKERWNTGKLFSYESGGMCYDETEQNDADEKELKLGRNALYFTGIIDFLQTYSAKKKVETLIKGLTRDKSTISAIEPALYAKRLYSFIQKYVE